MRGERTNRRNLKEKEKFYFGLAVGLLLFPISCKGHGTLDYPKPYLVGEYESDQMGCQGLSCFSLTNYTFVFGSPTISKDSPYITYPAVDGDPFVNNPYRAPGSAPVFDGCGVFGGNPSPRGCDGVPKVQGNPNQCDGAGSAFGNYVASLEDQAMVRTWIAGSSVEVKWSIQANHGGGYQYRLCKKPNSASTFWQTEECFQKTILEFASNTQIAEWNNGTRLSWSAIRFSQGTFPINSTWTMNPIPAYGGISGQDTSRGTQFSPPAQNGPVGYSFDDVGIIDQLHIPMSLERGRYALSWRWDAEQTPQVWLSCAAIDIISDDDKNMSEHDSYSRHCGSSNGACGINCEDNTNASSCEGFWGSGFYTIQQSVCEYELSDDGNDNNSTGYTFFSNPLDLGICSAPNLCGLSCSSENGNCLIYLNDKTPLGSSRAVCNMVNGSWITNNNINHENKKSTSTRRHQRYVNYKLSSEELVTLDSLHRAMSNDARLRREQPLYY